MISPISLPALHLTRLPGERGPVLRCTGELSVATVEALRRELALLEPLGHPALTLNLSGCSFLDVEGILTVLQSFKRLRQSGRQLVVVAGAGRIARLFRVMGLDEILPVFPSELVAARAMRGGGPPPPAPPTWELARATALARWRTLQAGLDEAPPEEILHHLTSMTALCQRAEEIQQDDPSPAGVRCRFCPLFYALGGRPEDVGCQSALDPIIAAVRAENTGAARARVAEIIHLLEEMPLPEERSS